MLPRGEASLMLLLTAQLTGKIVGVFRWQQNWFLFSMSDPIRLSISMIKYLESITSVTVAGQMLYPFLLSTASSFMPTSNLCCCISCWSWKQLHTQLLHILSCDPLNSIISKENVFLINYRETHVKFTQIITDDNSNE